MCGRYTLRASPAMLAEVFELLRTPDLGPRYNIAPTQQVAVIRRNDGGRVLSTMHWGLIPSWAKDRSIAARMINARSETLAEKPSFRTPFHRRRCLIPADGFFEWKTLAPQKKQPFLIEKADGQPFAFAGLWELWKPPEGEAIESCTIITTEANGTLRSLHDRMPVILDERDYDAWMDPELKATDSLLPLLRPADDDLLTLHAVSTTVNNARHEGADCIASVPEPS